MSRTGIAFLGEPSVGEMVRLACRAEALGYDSVWATETRFTRDALVPCAAIAQATSTIRVGTAVVNSYTREAVLLAVSFATLDELAGGRMIAGLGPGSPRILQAQGIAFDAPLARLREYVTVLRRLLAHERTTFAGEHVHVQDLRLDFRPVRADLPVMLGVTGPRAVQLAGEIADGVLFNGFLPEAYYGRAMEHLAAGRARRGDPDGNGGAGSSFEVAAFIAASVDEDPDVARDRVRPLIATYLTTFPNIARETGYPADGLESLKRRAEAEGIAAAATLIDDEWVDALTIAGTPDECRARIGRYRTWGVDVPVLAPVANAELAVETFAPQPPRR